MPLSSPNLRAVTRSVPLPRHHVHQLVGGRPRHMQHTALIIEHLVEVRLLELAVIAEDVRDHLLVELIVLVDGLVRLVHVRECTLVKVQGILVVLEELRELVLRVCHVMQSLVVIAHVVIHNLLRRGWW